MSETTMTIEAAWNEACRDLCATVEYAALRPVLDLPIWVYSGPRALEGAVLDAREYAASAGGAARVCMRVNGGGWIELTDLG